MSPANQRLDIGVLKHLKILCISEIGWFDDAALLGDIKAASGAEAAVIKVPNARWGERPIALVVLKPDHKADAESIRALLMDYANKGIISKYGVPERIVFIEAIVKTSVGKLDKKELRSQYGH